MKLNLGCADRAIPGFVGVDIVAPADQLVDLSGVWPWPDKSVDEVLAFDVFEHLPDKRHTMNELWRVLKPGGIATVGVPDVTDGDGGHCDPTHQSYWTGSDFEYFEVGDFARERFRNSEYYHILADFEVVSFEKIRHQRKRGYSVEIKVKLRAV
jgi:SAM-dependent methyltransferase